MASENNGNIAVQPDHRLRVAVVASVVSLLFFASAANAQPLGFPDDEASFTVEFSNTPLEHVAAAISRATQRTIQISDSRFGETIVSYKPERTLTRPELWRAFVQLVESEGLTITASQEVWVIAEKQEAAADSEALAGEAEL